MIRPTLLCLLISMMPFGLEAQSAVVQECPQSDRDTLPPLRVATALQLAGGSRTSIATAVRLCGDSAKWLALVNLPNRDIGNEYGSRFALLVDSAGGSVVRYVTRGLRDSHTPEFRLFRSGVNYLLLAAEGDEGGSWGMATYDVGPFMIAELGQLDVGLAGDSAIGNDDGALEEAGVLYRVDGWRVTFGRKIVLRPNQDDRRELAPPPGGRLVFRPSGNWRVDQ